MTTEETFKTSMEIVASRLHSTENMLVNPWYKGKNRRTRKNKRKRKKEKKKK